MFIDEWDEVVALVNQAQTGDRDAFNVLVKRFEGSVIAGAMKRVSDYNEAQDLAQDVFMHAWKKLPQLKDARCFAGWLRRITHRMAINRLTRGTRINGDPELMEQAEGRAANPSHEMERVESVAFLQAGLGQLKGIDRDVLEAFYLQGRSLKKIATELDVPVGTVKRRLHTARKRLKVVLDEAIGVEGGSSFMANFFDEPTPMAV